MATSGTISSTLTVRQVITTSLENLGAIALGDTPEAEVSELGIKHLNWMLKTWQADGLNQFRVEEVSITWPASTATATLDTNFLDFLNGRSRVSGVDQTMEQISISDYAEISNKSTTSSRPTQYRVRKTISTLEIALWPVPSVDITILGDGVRVIEDVTSLDETIDIPQEWLEAVFICLAARLARPLRTHISDPALAAAIQQDAATAYARLRSFDQEETSVFFSPSFN
jgi:hypothetical protein